MLQQYENNPEYKALAGKWQEYKDLEQLANTGRLKTERAILELVGNDLKEKGVNHLPENLDITTGMDEKYEENKIDLLFANFKEGLLPELPFFPFKTEWKPDTKKIAVIKDMMPGVFVNIFKDALTIKPKKPSFSIKNK